MIFRSTYPDLPIPEDQTLWSVLEEQHAVGNVANSPAYICSVTNREVTFAQLVARAKHVAAGLHAHGIRKGDVVVLHSFNCIEYPIVFLALNRLGAISSPSSPLFNAEELHDQLVVAKAKAIVTHKALADVALGGAKLTGIDTSMVFTMAPAPVDLDLVATESFIEQELPLPELAPTEPSAVVFLPFSSGTTARPKGVELTAHALLASSICFGHLDKPGKYTLGLLPFFHIMATMIFHSCLYVGKSLVVLPRFQPERFLDVVEKYKMEKILVAPPVVLFLAQHPMVDNYDLSHVKTIGCGGAPLGVEIEALAEKRLGATIFQGFGMTELGGAGSYATAGSKRAGSTGKLLPNTLLKVRCLKTGASLPANEIGELLFHSPSVMRGYLDNEEATRATFCPDGFLHSGDIGYIDDDGFVFILDRIKELIKYKGHQVAPAELEDVLNNHPDVKDSCCVRGFDFNTQEEIPKAYVVLHGSAGAETGKSIMEYVASKVAKYKIVREVEFIDAVPKSLSGKILRRELQVRENEKIAAFRAENAP